MIDRAIAARARTLVQKRRQDTAEHEQETKYRSQCESLPMLLRSAGLTRTVSYLAAKQDCREVLKDMQDQLQRAGIYSDAAGRTLDLPQWATRADLAMAEYRHVSALSMKVAFWHKRLAQALLRQKGDA